MTLDQITAALDAAAARRARVEELRLQLVSTGTPEPLDEQRRRLVG